MKFAALVYQAGIANVFQLNSMSLNPNTRDKRLLQGDFRACEMYAQGLKAAGVKVTSAACNQAGDISMSEWDTDLQDMPFADAARPVFS